MGLVSIINGARTISLNPASRLRLYREEQEQRDRQRREELSKKWLLMQVAENLKTSSRTKSSK